MAKCLKYLSLNLENYRRRSGLNKLEFAEKIGVSASYLSQLLSISNDNPKYDTLEEIAETLETTVAKLLSDPFEPWKKEPSVADFVRIIEEALLVRAVCSSPDFVEIIHVAQMKNPSVVEVSQKVD